MGLRRQSGGSWLALFALALQLALSFGHIHAEDFARPAAAPVTAQAGHGPTAPSHGGDTDHDDCPICSVMHLARTLVLPLPPQISLPVPARIFWTAAVERQIAAAAQWQPFQARAPPQA